MSSRNEQEQAEFTTGYYYSCLYNSLVLFAAPPLYLKSLDGPGFSVPFEMETEYEYAFGEFIFNENFKRGKVDESLRDELLQFKQRVDRLPNELWTWEEILSNDGWNEVRQSAERLLAQLGETRREYDFSFTNVFGFK